MAHIFAIGGGEHDAFFRAMISATGMASPRVLVLAHAQRKAAKEAKHLSAVCEAFAGRYGLAVEALPRATVLREPSAAVRAVLRADIIYECGGDTVGMLRFWRETGLARLFETVGAGKVLCGVSAGGNCWFARCSSKALPEVEGDPSAAMLALDGLGLVRAFFVPHAQLPGRMEHMRRELRDGEVAVALSDGAAIEVDGDAFRVILGESGKPDAVPFALRALLRGGIVVTEPISAGEFRPLSELLDR